MSHTPLLLINGNGIRVYLHAYVSEMDIAFVTDLSKAETTPMVWRRCGTERHGYYWIGETDRYPETRWIFRDGRLGELTSRKGRVTKRILASLPLATACPSLTELYEHVLFQI